jgi:hypothetical protein
MSSAVDSFVYSDLPQVSTVGEFRLFVADINRIIEVLRDLEEPLDSEHLLELKRLASGPQRTVIGRMQQLLDGYCLTYIQINPEMRVKVRQGPAAPHLMRAQWRSFLLKVRNDAGINPVLRVTIPNRRSTRQNLPSFFSAKIYCDPLGVPSLSGQLLEYKILQIWGYQPGKWEGCLSFDIGQGSQDLGFRSELPILFSVKP